MDTKGSCAPRRDAGGTQGTDYQRTLEFSAPSASPAKKINPKSKRAHVLRCFLQRGSRGLSCFEAVDLCRDYVLRTSVSELVRFHGIGFTKRYEHFTNSGGSRTDYVRYALTAEGAQRARELLEDA